MTDIDAAQAAIAAAATEDDVLVRHLLVAAALCVLLPDAVVVGGTAEAFWTGVARPTDLDLCAPQGPTFAATLRALGFARVGRHWVHRDLDFGVEFPDTLIQGDRERTVMHEVSPDLGVRIIGADDLYLDRVRQATMDESREGIEFEGAVAIAKAAFSTIDWLYVRRSIAEEAAFLAEPMKRLDARVRARVLSDLADPP